MAIELSLISLKSSPGSGAMTLSPTATPERPACASLSTPQHLDSGVPTQRTSDRALAPSRGRSMQDAGYGFPRTRLFLGSRVNKGKQRAGCPPSNTLWRLLVRLTLPQPWSSKRSKGSHARVTMLIAEAGGDTARAAAARLHAHLT